MAYVGIKAFLDPTGPVNQGFVKPIHVICPAGTVVNAVAPAATGGFTEVAYNLADLVLVALADVDPSRACAWGSATSNHQYIAGLDPSLGKRFIYYDYQPGGCGGTAVADGAGTTRDLASGFTQLQSIEIIESRFPVKVRRHEIRADSGGPGKWRGGWGHIREVQVLGRNASISVIGEHAIFPPAGLVGGRPGAAQQWSLITPEGESALSPMGAKVGRRELSLGCVVRVMTAGGGGFGDPLERDPELVASDVRLGYVSREMAGVHYGVELSEVGDVDQETTLRIRRKSMVARIRLWLGPTAPSEAAGHPISVARLNPRTAQALGSCFAELLTATHAGPLRVLIEEDPSIPEDQIAVDRGVRSMLDAEEEGVPVYVRPLDGVDHVLSFNRDAYRHALKDGA